jgi:hypothetical protein
MLSSQGKKTKGTRARPMTVVRRKNSRDAGRLIGMGGECSDGMELVTHQQLYGWQVGE